jgi:hypothetical protein
MFREEDVRFSADGGVELSAWLDCGACHRAGQRPDPVGAKRRLAMTERASLRTALFAPRSNPGVRTVDSGLLRRQERLTMTD